MSTNNQFSIYLPIFANVLKRITLLFESILVSGTFSVAIPESRLIIFFTILVVPLPVAVVCFWMEGGATVSTGHLDGTVVVALAVGLKTLFDLVEASYVVLVAGNDHVAAKACCC